MRSRRRPFRSLGLLILALGIVGSLLYILGAAIFQSRLHSHYSFDELLIPRLNDVLVAGFFFVIGASVGSFLNVVVWRLPSGRGVGGHSFCPRCRHRLRSRDNLPVFGWFFLEGRCRDCRLPISTRYPSVEAAVALSFAMVGTAETFRWSLPYDRFPPTDSPIWIPIVDGALLITLSYHLVALACLWAMALIAWDGHRLPRPLVRFAGLALISGMFLFPFVAVVPWQLSVPRGWPPTPWWLDAPWYRSPDDIAGSRWNRLTQQSLHTAYRILTSLAAAGFLARVLGRALCSGADLKLNPLSKPTGRLIDLVMLLALVAIVVGWQASLGVVLMASLLSMLLPWAVVHRVLAEAPTSAVGSSRARSSLPFARFSLALPVALTVQLTFWRPLIGTGIWPSETASRPALLVALVAVILVPSWLGRRTPENASEIVPTRSPTANVSDDSAG